MRKFLILALLPFVVFAFSACDGKAENDTQNSVQLTSETVTETVTAAQTQATAQQEETTQMNRKTLELAVDGTALNVQWEDNDAVDDLLKMVQNGEITVETSRYGGFEQVGSLPDSLTRNDSQMTAQPGDIMLYSGNQIVIFFGSNSWSYTKLGHVSGVSENELSTILDKETATVTISVD